MSTVSDRIAQDIKDIVQTRVAIAEKLGAIEQHVGSTMHHARTVINQVADKTTTTVRDTMQTAKEAFDPTVQAARHPWGFVGGALVLGYTVGALYRRGWRITTGVMPYYPPGAKGAAVMETSGSSSSERHKPGVYAFYPEQATDHERAGRGEVYQPTIWAELEHAFRDELDVARSGLIRFGRGLLRETVRRAVPALAQFIGGSHRERDTGSDRRAS